MKKKFHRIPVVLIAVMLALVLVGGAAFAAFNVLSGTTDVEVKEAITAEYAIFGEYYPISVAEGPFALTLEPYYPGESDIGYYRVYNKSQAVLPVSITIEDVPSGWDLVGNGIDLTEINVGVWKGTVDVPTAAVLDPEVQEDEGLAEFQITMTVPTDVEPDIYTFQVAIARE